MRRFTTIASALVLAAGLGGAAVAQGQGQGKGQGKGAGPPHAEAQADRGRGGGQPPGHAGPPPGRGADRGPPGHERRAESRPDRPSPADLRRDDRGRSDRPSARRIEVREPGRERVRLPSRGIGLIDGCPPGLARRDNGCLPPGLARQRTRYERLWSRHGEPYRYADGYLYRLSPQGTVLGYAPVLGGALALGSPWPQAYAAEPLPPYYRDYFRLGDGYDYRYADGVVYGVDPTTQAIRQVAALLTGDAWSVGQPMPAGYDVYNVPYDYRDRYPDSPDRWRRYSDGYVYEIDPTTRLVMAAIQLLT